MNDKRTVAWFSAFVVVVVLIGVASGVLLDRFLLRPPPGRVGAADDRVFGTGQRAGQGLMDPDMRGGGRRGPGEMGPGGGRGQPSRPGGLTERLAQELRLTAAQTAQVGAILLKRRAQLDTIRAEMQGRMQKEQADLRAEIRGVLDEDQKRRFDEVTAMAPGLGGMGLQPRGMRRTGPPEGGPRQE
jgi:hypothetical protein